MVDDGNGSVIKKYKNRLEVAVTVHFFLNDMDTRKQMLKWQDSMAKYEK